MLRKLIVLGLILCVAMPTLAQVEFHVDRQAVSEFSGLTEENKTVVEFMYLTQKDEFCTMFTLGSRTAELSVCVFEDLLTSEQHLYIVYDGYSASFVLFYEGEAIGRIGDESGVSNLVPGDYELIVFYGSGWPEFVEARVSFTVGRGSDVADSPIARESIRLETPELGKTWYQSEKHGMASGCKVAYVLNDFDSPLIAIVLKGENTIREVTSQSLYGSSSSVLVPSQEEEGEWEGFTAFVSAYLNPKHQEEYKLQYEKDGKLYEVVFEYESGITGSRKVAGAIVVEC